MCDGLLVPQLTLLCVVLVALVEILFNQFVLLSTTPVKHEELERAKTQLKSQLLINLESRVQHCDDIGRSMLTYGKREDPQIICDKISKVTAQDLLRAAQRMMSNDPSFVVRFLDSFKTVFWLVPSFNSLFDVCFT